MRKIITLLFMFLLLTLTGCEDKKTTDNAIPVENTTEAFGDNNIHDSNNDRFKVTKKSVSKSSTEKRLLTDTFRLNDTKNTYFSVTVSNQKVTFKESPKAIVLVTFFATWCPPCVADISYLNDLYLKYTKDLLISGVLVHDSISQEGLKSFLAKHDTKYFISTSTHNNDFASLVAKTLNLPRNYPLPLTVMYVEGKYYTHYEGSVPIEMIDYDIKQALKILK